MVWDWFCWLLVVGWLVGCWLVGWFDGLMV